MNPGRRIQLPVTATLRVVVLAVLLPLVASGQASERVKRLGFPLRPALIPVADIRAGGPPKDGIPALSDPHVLPVDRIEFLKDQDLVIGVVIEGTARAYPLRVLDWHELVNDRIGETDILVSYCPLCRSALVFDRRVGGRVREFGVSGLLWNSNVLMFDRQKDPNQESLWSQGLMKAVTGPAAGEKLELTLLPSETVTWKDWKRRHPRTEALSNLTGHRRPYEKTAYEAALGVSIWGLL